MSEKILIVDDDDSVRNIYGEILLRVGYEVFLANNVKNAMIVYDANPEIGIVLSDLKLNNGMDGVSLCSRLKHRNLKIVMIAITGFMDDYSLEYCLYVGFKDVLQKPISAEDLLEVVACAVKQRERWGNR